MDVIVKILLTLAISMSAVGVGIVLLRRKSIWTMSGQVTALKGVILGAVAVASTEGFGPGQNYLLIAVIALAGILLLCAVGMAVMIRCQRFDGTLDYAKEQQLKN